MYFVVRVGGLHVVWQMTPKQMYARVNAEPGLLDCLHQHPFATQAEAVERRDTLNTSRKAPLKVQMIGEAARKSA